MNKYFKVYSEEHCDKNFISSSEEEDYWIDEFHYERWFNELQLEEKDCELTGNEYSDRFCAEQYYGSPEYMFEKRICNEVIRITEANIEEATKYEIDNSNGLEIALRTRHISPWMIHEITMEEYDNSVKCVVGGGELLN